MTTERKPYVPDPQWIKEMVVRTRADQGLPSKIVDSVVLDKIAYLIREELKHRRPHKDAA